MGLRQGRGMPAFCAAMFCALFGWIPNVHASCAARLESGWSTLEQQAWSALSAGRVFDGLVAVADLGGDPELSAEFLRGVLTCDQLVAQLPEQIVSLRNVAVRQPLDVSRRMVQPRFECENCAFKEITGVESKWKGGIAFTRVRLFDKLNLSSSTIDSSISLTDSQLDSDLDLTSSVIGGDLVAKGESRIGRLIADSTQFAGSVELYGADIQDYASFWGTSVARDVLLTSNDGGRRTVIGSQVSAEELRKVNADSPPALSFGSAKIDRRISITDTVVNGRLDMDAVRIAEDLWLRNCSAVAGPINLVFARVGQNIDLSSTILSDVDLTGARVGGELRLGAPRGWLTAPVWKPGARLVLRNVELSSWTDATGNGEPRDPACLAINVKPDPWPEQFDAIGFSYQNVGGLGGSLAAAHDVDWFCRWLDRQTPYSFEPYQHAASYLRRVGLDDGADEVLYCGKVREIDNTPSWLNKALLQLQRGFVGFGYHVERSLIWAALFILLGQQIFVRTKEAKAHRMTVGLAYSIEMFIPALSLRRLHQDIDLAGWQRYYFYIHKIMGWLLGSLVVASFAGLLGE